MSKHTSKRDKRQLFTVLSVVTAALLIASAAAYSSRSKSGVNVDTPTITKEELSKYNGVAGAQCYVAVENIVYEIKQGKKWKDGAHIPSGNQAYCGRDLSDVIQKSPHGASILDILHEVGKLE